MQDGPAAPSIPSRKTIPLSLRLVIGLWLAAGVAVTVRTLISPVEHSVFPVLAGGSLHWWQDEPLYADYRPLDYFRYPPAFAVIFTPCAALGLAAGGILWSWMSLAVYGAGLYALCRGVLPGPWPDRRLALFLALGLFGGLRGLWNAQSNALVVGLLFLAAAALVRGRWWNAAVLLAAPVCLKLTPLAPALLLCALWPRRLAGRFALAVVVGFLVPFLTRPPDVVLWHYREWLDHLVDSSKERWLGFRDGWTVWLVLRQMLEGKAGLPPLQEPMDSVVYRVLQLLAAAAALGWCLLQRRADASPRRLVTVTLAMGMAWLMFFGPAIEHATYVFLAPLVTWGWLKRNSWPRGRVLIDAAFLLVMVLGWGAITRPLVQSVPLLLAALPLGTLLFALWLACGPFAERLVRERRTLSWTCFPHVQPGRP